MMFSRDKLYDQIFTVIKAGGDPTPELVKLEMEASDNKADSSYFDDYIQNLIGIMRFFLDKNIDGGWVIFNAISQYTLVYTNKQLDFILDHIDECYGRYLHQSLSFFIAEWYGGLCNKRALYFIKKWASRHTANIPLLNLQTAIGEVLSLGSECFDDSNLAEIAQINLKLNNLLIERGLKS